MLFRRAYLSSTITGYRHSPKISLVVNSPCRKPYNASLSAVWDTDKVEARTAIQRESIYFQDLSSNQSVDAVCGAMGTALIHKHAESTAVLEEDHEFMNDKNDSCTVSS